MPHVLAGRFKAAVGDIPKGLLNNISSLLNSSLVEIIMQKLGHVRSSHSTIDYEKRHLAGALG